jgi:integrase
VFTIGRADAIGLADARDRARDLLGQVARGTDPQAEKLRGTRAETFQDVAARYLEHAKRPGGNKSWRQADALVTKHLLPRWGKLRARDVTRGDVRAVVRKLTEGGAPVMANQVLASASAIFAWAIREELGDIAVNPCHGVTRNATKSRERVLSESELPRFWAEFDRAGLVRSAALKTILLTGQRPGEVSCMRREHISGGWWELPGDPDLALGWPGTKNGAGHRVWLTAPVLDLLAEVGEAKTGFAFPADERGARAVAGLDGAMRDTCAALGILAPDKVTPHDLRRTHGTMITSLGFGRDAMNRIQNHREGGIADVYDQHQYADENQKIQEAVTRRIMTLIGRVAGGNVVELRA